jgi:hypothetical protein
MNVLCFAISLLLAQPAEKPTVLVVVGAEGAGQYAEPFRQWAERWQKAADRAGARFLSVGLDPPGDATDLERFKTLLADEPRRSSEALWLVLIGHGTFDGNAARFNLRGPDVAAATLAEWIEPFERPLAVIDCSSSSAPFINRLSGPGRVVITATKSGYELNYSRFGDYLSTAVGDVAADLDKDGQTSLLEAFLWASGRVAEFYDQEGRLSTETALVEDNGDGQGTPASWFRGVRVVRRAKAGAVPDGVAAHQLHLIRSAAEAEMPPAVRARRDELEQAIEALRASRDDQTDLEAYYAQLEPLVVDLARLYEQAP